MTTRNLVIDITNYSNTVTPLIVHNDNLKLLQLDADGTLYSRKVKVNVYQWPDYVFNQDYSLMSLNEVKSYIEINNHLPEVPSAEEAEMDGIDVGEMNKILLQKIEELTLYIIQQEERITQLENRSH